MDASCLRRDAYLNRVLAVELDYLDTEVALPNSTEAKKFIAERLDHLVTENWSACLCDRISSSA
jgi:hypothetical protein